MSEAVAEVIVVIEIVMVSIPEILAVPEMIRVTEIIAVPETIRVTEIIAVLEMIINNESTVVTGVDLGILTEKGAKTSVPREEEGDITQVAMEGTEKRHGVKVAVLQQEEHELRLLHLGTTLPCLRMSSVQAKEVEVKIPGVVLVSVLFI